MPDSPNLVSIGELSRRTGISAQRLRRWADAGLIASERTAGGHRRFDAARAVAALHARLPEFGPAGVAPAASATWREAFTLHGLEEHLVWRSIVEQLSLDEDQPAVLILRYGVTEMLNNAIDHSSGSQAVVEIWLLDSELAFRVADDGAGAFAHLRKGLGLVSDVDAIAELSKGKRTTWRERHTGEGIFFTSKQLDLFQIAANQLRWTVDNIRHDQAVGTSEVRAGTVVAGRVDRSTTRTTREVFEAFSEDFEFVRTQPVVKLFEIGQYFVSRSEARRLAAGLEQFTDVVLDFAGVRDVGQGFVDELFRVWAVEHPQVRVTPINMNDAVAFMLRRGLSPGSP